MPCSMHCCFTYLYFVYSFTVYMAQLSLLVRCCTDNGGRISPFRWEIFPGTVEEFPLLMWKDFPSYCGRKLGIVEEFPPSMWKKIPLFVEGFPPSAAVTYDLFRQNRHKTQNFIAIFPFYSSDRQLFGCRRLNGGRNSPQRRIRTALWWKEFPPFSNHPWRR